MEFTSEGSSLAKSLYSLLRHYAHRKENDSEMIAALRLSYENCGELFVQGFLSSAALQPEGKLFPYIVQSLPEIWWIESEMAINLSTPLAAALVPEVAQSLCRDTQSIIEHLDRQNTPLEAKTTAQAFSAIVENNGHLDHRTRTLARGAGMALKLAPATLASLLAFVAKTPSLELLSAMAADERLIEQEHWVTSLLLRGGRIEVALGAASLLHAPQAILSRVRDLLCMAPAKVFQRVAEIHGLLTLAGEEGLESSEFLRTALLSQAWQGHSLRGIPWTQSFRGEQIVSRSLAEIPEVAKGLASDVLHGLPELVDIPHGLCDVARREPLALCLAWLVQRDPAYCAGLRSTEGRIREIGRTLGTSAQRDALRHYLGFLLTAGRNLLKRGEEGHDGALKIYTRILRLKKAHPDLVTREILPNTLFGSSRIGDPERAARRWLVREQAEVAGSSLNLDTDLVDLPQSLANEYFPALDSEGVTTLDGLSPLPAAACAWAGASIPFEIRWYKRLIPSPLYFAYNVIKRICGFRAAARVHLTDDGKAVLVTEHSFWGNTIGQERRLLPDGRVFPFPLDRTRVHQMLGRWTAFLLAACTIGAFFTLQGVQTGDNMHMMLGSLALVAGLAGYASAIRLHRILGAGLAFVARDSAGFSHLWRIDAATRHLLTRPPSDIKPE
jgi:hypothetical protein